MNKNFYGYCTSYSEGAYNVNVQDKDIKNINRGDLLTVFFAIAQTKGKSIRLKLDFNDTEQEMSTADDTGIFVKTLDIETKGLDQGWDSGETVIFCYTQRGQGPEHYWELVDSAPATTKIYGVTKLFDVNNLEKVLGGDENYNDDVLTPETLKKFFDKLKGEEEEEQPSSLIGLKWEPNSEIQDNEFLGTLSLDNGSTPISIKYPLTQTIQNFLSEFNEKEYTGQLINNGNGDGSGTEEGKSLSGEPFITRIIPDNLYFSSNTGLYYDSGNSIPLNGNASKEAQRIILNNVPDNSINENFLLLGCGNVTKVKINPGLEIAGNTNITGKLTTTGTIDASSAQIKTLGDVKGATLHGNIIYENTTNGFKPLSQIYSKELFTVTHKISNIKIGKATYKTNQEFLVPTTCKINGVNISCRPLGVVGYNISTPTNGYGASYCMLFALMFYEKKGDEYKPRVIYNVRNTHTTKEVTVDLELKILYETN